MIPHTVFCQINAPCALIATLLNSECPGPYHRGFWIIFAHFWPIYAYCKGTIPSESAGLHLFKQACLFGKILYLEGPWGGGHLKGMFVCSLNFIAQAVGCLFKHGRLLQCLQYVTWWYHCRNSTWPSAWHRFCQHLGIVLFFAVFHFFCESKVQF